jgi:hypothetical protein
MTPKYRDQMIGIISKEMNRVYGLYTQRNPGFLGKVTIVGHSLGVSSAVKPDPIQKTHLSFVVYARL